MATFEEVMKGMGISPESKQQKKAKQRKAALEEAGGDLFRTSEGTRRYDVPLPGASVGGWWAKRLFGAFEAPNKFRKLSDSAAKGIKERKKYPEME